MIKTLNPRGRAAVVAAAGLTAVLAAGETPAQSAHPLDTLQPGHWYVVPNSRLDAVTPDPLPPNGSGSGAIMDAWSGAAFDTKRERLIVWGGGHNDYSGNEVYVFDVKKLRWERLNEPTRNVGGSDNCFYTDGSPKSRHTYDQIEYLPAIDKFVAFGCSSPYPQSRTYDDVVAFDFETLQWSRLASTAGTDYGATSAVDPTTGHAWYHGAGSYGHLREYDPIANTWTRRSASGVWIDYELTGALDPVKRRYIAVGMGLFWEWNMDGGPNSNPVRITTSGPRTAQNVDSPGLEYDPVIKKFVAWGGGASVYTIDLDTHTWTEVPPAPTNTVVPTRPNPRGTFGRFRYIPSRNAYILVNATNENVYFYKLSAGAGVTQPQVSLKASQTQVGPQGTVTLTWSASAADSCKASGGWSGTKGTSGSELVGPLSVTTSFVLTCSNSDGGQGSASVQVQVVTDNPVPTVDLSADPAEVAPGEPAMLSWTTSDASSCTASGGWSGSKPTMGSEATRPLSQNTTFTLTCTGAGGTSSDSVQVTVASEPLPPAPTLAFSASPTTVSGSQTSTLTWSATNATSCVAGGAWAGNKPVTGSDTVGPLATTSTYTLTCTGDGGSETKTVTVSVVSSTVAPPQEESSSSGGGGGLDLFSLLFALAALARLHLRARPLRPTPGAPRAPGG